MTTKHTITLGADPEFFLIDRKTNMYVSAHDIVPGTKQKPHQMKHGGHIQADGTAVEFNIPPAKSPKEFATNIELALHDIGDFVDTAKYQFAFDSCAVFNKDYFKSLPDWCKELGCDPDFNAYTGAQNELYVLPPNTRTASGHLHVGFLDEGDSVSNPKNIEHFSDCRVLCSALDLSMIPLSQSWMSVNTARTKTYGRSGNFRPKSYGVEYRTLSNEWLRHPSMWQDMFKVVENAVKRCKISDVYYISKTYNSYTSAILRGETWNETFTRSLTERAENNGLYVLKKAA